MTPNITLLIAGNWKMNGTSASLPELEAMNKGFHEAAGGKKIESLICLPATLISRAHEAVKGGVIALGGEDCHFAESGAHTGDISASMLKDAGATHVIVGHSERRTDHHESSELVRKKADAAWKSGLVAVICVGETLEQREQGKALDIVGQQCDASVPDGATAHNLVVAYEPVWAIGTGKIPTTDDVAKMHAFIREKMEKRFGAEGKRVHILYGGSMKPNNAAELLAVPHVDGGLIGGASLKAKDYLAIVQAAASVHK